MSDNLMEAYDNFMLDDIENDEELYTSEPEPDDYDKKIDPDDFEDSFNYDTEDVVIKTPKKVVANVPTPFPANAELEYNNQLNIGILVELEHVHWWTEENPQLDTDIIEQIATNIAKDHLKVTPDYYTKLIAANLVDEQDAIDLFISIYGQMPTNAKKPLPTPKVINRDNGQTNYSEIGNNYKVDVELTPTKTVSKIQPEGDLTENVKFDSYENMLGSDNIGSGNFTDASFEIPDDFDVDGD